ncbi:hypothetical protein A2U01_0101049, partial [Trifolium medium]|nr:hypothetical protein [Trifolium medium]
MLRISSFSTVVQQASTPSSFNT